MLLFILSLATVSLKFELKGTAAGDKRSQVVDISIVGTRPSLTLWPDSQTRVLRHDQHGNVQLLKCLFVL